MELEHLTAQFDAKGGGTGIAAYSTTHCKITMIAIISTHVGALQIPRADWWKYISGQELQHLQAHFTQQMEDLK